MNRLTERIEQAFLAPIEDESLQSSIQIGVSIGAVVAEGSESGWEELIARADQAMYAAKSG